MTLPRDPPLVRVTELLNSGPDRRRDPGQVFLSHKGSDAFVQGDELRQQRVRHGPDWGHQQNI